MKDKRLIPSRIVLYHIELFLDELKKKQITPFHINNSIEGSVIIEFRYNNKYFILDYDNEGEIAFLIRNSENKRWTYDLNENNFISFIMENL